MATPRTTPGMSRSAIRDWTTQLGAATLGRQRPQRSTGILAAIGSVALATLAIYFLRKIAPVVSLSVVYLPAVLLVATYWGIALGLFTSLLSAASFNFFHIPPTGKFTIVDGRNWVALAAFTIVALFASALAELARSRAQEAERRRAEADLAAALAHELLLGEDTQAALASAGRRVAEALELTSAAIEPVSGHAHRVLRRPTRGGRRSRCGGSTVSGWRRSSSPPTSRPTPSSGCGPRSSPRWRRSSPSPSAATPCRPSWSRRRPCAAPTTSRRRCCAPSPTICALR